MQTHVHTQMEHNTMASSISQIFNYKIYSGVTVMKKKNSLFTMCYAKFCYAKWINKHYSWFQMIYLIKLNQQKHDVIQLLSKADLLYRDVADSFSN